MLVLFFLNIYCIDVILYAVNSKRIGTFYLIFGFLCGILGTVLSVFIRVELNWSVLSFLAGNFQIFNVLITGHAVLMVFFLVA